MTALIDAPTRPPTYVRPAVTEPTGKGLVPPPPVVADLVDNAANALPDSMANAVRLTMGEHGAGAGLGALIRALGPLKSVGAIPLGDQAPFRTDSDPRCMACPHLSLCGGDTDACDWQHCEGACGPCPIRCPDRDDIDAWLRDVGGLTLNGLPGTFTPATDDWPAILPASDPASLREVGYAPYWPAWSVSLRRVIAREQQRLWPNWTAGNRAAELRRAGVNKLVLQGPAADNWLAKAWSASLQVRSDLATAGFDTAIAPSYSVYEDDPRMEHLVAYRQAAVTAARWNRSVPTVPHLYWHRRIDLDRQLAWLLAGGVQPTAIAVDLSTILSANDFLDARAALTYLAAALPGTRQVIVGLAHLDRLAVLANDGLAPLTVVTHRAAVAGLNHQMLTRDAQWVPEDDVRTAVIGTLAVLHERLTGERPSWVDAALDCFKAA